jgi:glyoxylase-like metal-dependent hydrolase (beta-lactamase superfamily II)
VEKNQTSEKDDRSMELYPGAELIECEMDGRPLYLPLLREGNEALLLDCGTRAHAETDIPNYLNHVGIGKEGLTWTIITHPDCDHCGGLHELKTRYPALRTCCGEADRDLIESPEHLFNFRYDAYRQDHHLCYDSATAEKLKNYSSGFERMTLTFTDGETLRLGEDRVLEIWHLPGHSHGHLGLFDRKYRTLYYGDAIQGAGYKSISGGWALCPTYLYVETYLQTIRAIEKSGAEMIVGCHWPVWRGAEQIRDFCAESRNFVALADRLIYQYIRSHSGASLRELCEVLGSQLGDWPRVIDLELSFAFSGHVSRGVANGTLEIDHSARPVVYKIRA